MQQKRHRPRSAARGCQFIALTLVAMLPAGCIGYERSSTLGPSTTGVAALLGSWSSSNIPSAANCTDFRWDVTEQTGNSASGSFSATCAGDLKVSGTARGTLTGSTINWSAQASATVANLPACAISLTGTAEIGVDSIRVPYSGDTCVGPVSGVEVLRRR
jgi:hypothetical protein